MTPIEIKPRNQWSRGIEVFIRTTVGTLLDFRDLSSLDLSGFPTNTGAWQSRNRRVLAGKIGKAGIYSTYDNKVSRKSTNSV
jgi:hypothetical protein